MHIAFLKVRRMLGKFTGLTFLTAAALFAQSNQGRITGTISDPAGAVVPSAQIETKNTEGLIGGVIKVCPAERAGDFRHGYAQGREAGNRSRY